MGSGEFLGRAEGLGGLQVPGGLWGDPPVSPQASVVAKWRNLTEESGPGGAARVLVGGTRLRDPQEALNKTGGLGLLVGPFLKVVETDVPGEGMARELRELLRSQTGLGWTMGTPWEAWGSPLRTPQLQLLVWGLPGTPVLSYGDEVGLARPPGSKPPPMPWERIQKLQESKNGSEWQVLELCRALGVLRAGERSLSLGGAEVLPAGGAVAVLRRWDQNDRFLLVLNPRGEPLGPVSLPQALLPPRATLRLSTHRSGPQSSEVELGQLQLQPYEGVLLSFPYNA
ncbi:4F2 cell-surface antigen heavy chain-like [Corapipo altera]|uniref:4F2 cell-surface antigen heavy chain-like n=2 Tax=Corapipo altera TaxID=415028 RepID=UPI000FD64C83|nr:4F2 cell-surface antigen heavy chain-like [Corapipo altera]